MAGQDKPVAPDVTSAVVELPQLDGRERNVHVRSAGKHAGPGSPTVVLVCGLGSGCLSFTGIQQGLAQSQIASFAFDRLGIGRSSSFPSSSAEETPTETKESKVRCASDLAVELHEVLQAAKVPPPYILVPHSFGGVIAWEYIAAHAEDVVGLVTIDANSARSAERPIRDPDLECLVEGIPEGAFDYCEIVGLNAANTLPLEIYEEAFEKRDPPPGWNKATGGGAAEAAGYDDSCRDLHRLGLLERHPLGKYPVTVIKGDAENDIRLLVAAAEKLGGGTKEARDELVHKLDGAAGMEEDQQRDHLQLTNTGARKFVDTKKSGHWIHITEPDLVIDEIRQMVRNHAKILSSDAC